LWRLADRGSIERFFIAAKSFEKPMKDFRWIGVAIGSANASLLTKMIQVLFGIAARYRFEIVTPSDKEWFEWWFAAWRETALKPRTIITKFACQIELFARAKRGSQLNCRLQMRQVNMIHILSSQFWMCAKKGWQRTK
jgi:hypothetical protein